MGEAQEYLEKDELGKETSDFIKKFTEISSENAKKLRKEISELDLMKLNSHHICKIVDFLPQSGEEMNKVVGDANLDEDEIKKILDKTKEFK